MKMTKIISKAILASSVFALLFLCAGAGVSPIGAQQEPSEDEKKAVAMQMADQAVQSVKNMFGEDGGVTINREKLAGKKKDNKTAEKKEADKRYDRQTCFQTDSGDVRCYEWSAEAGDGNVWVSADESAPQK